MQGRLKKMRMALAALAALLTGAGAATGDTAGFVFGAPALAQVTTIDPNDAIDSDLAQPGEQTDPYALPNQSTEIKRPEWLPPAGQSPNPQTVDSVAQPSSTQDPATMDPNADVMPPETGAQSANAAAATPAGGTPVTYQEDDLIGAAEGVFGKGAEGLAGVIEKILKDQGEPNGYIVGREASGAFVVGLRYGSGTLFHKVEGEKPVYWTGPSIGFDAGANAGNTFVLVYNLYDSEELYKRFGAGEGAAYLVGGFTASYLRKGDVVLIPVRLGVGLRLGANVGYMKFTKKRSFLPF